MLYHQREKKTLPHVFAAFRACTLSPEKKATTSSCLCCIQNECFIIREKKDATTSSCLCCIQNVCFIIREKSYNFLMSTSLQLSEWVLYHQREKEIQLPNIFAVFRILMCALSPEKKATTSSCLCCIQNINVCLITREKSHNFLMSLQLSERVLYRQRKRATTSTYLCCIQNVCLITREKKPQRPHVFGAFRMSALSFKKNNKNFQNLHCI